MMLALYRITSRTLQPKTVSWKRYSLPQFLSLFSVNQCNEFSTLEGIVETGKVKSYTIKKAYGFIISDKDEKDIFVHRSNIRGAPSDDIWNPILKKGERVEFKRVPREGGGNDEGGFVAQDVVFEGGNEIPIYRDSYSHSAKVAKSRLGIRVYDILSKGGDELEMAQQIADAYTKARDEVEKSKEKNHTEKDS